MKTNRINKNRFMHSFQFEKLLLKVQYFFKTAQCSRNKRKFRGWSLFSPLQIALANRSIRFLCFFVQVSDVNSLICLSVQKRGGVFLSNLVLKKSMS